MPKKTDARLLEELNKRLDAGAAGSRCGAGVIPFRRGSGKPFAPARTGTGAAPLSRDICDLVLAQQEHGLGSDLLAFVSAVADDDVGTRRASKPCRKDSLMGVVRRGTPTDWLSVMLNLANHGLGIVTEAERCGDLALRNCLACPPNKSVVSVSVLRIWGRPGGWSICTRKLNTPEWRATARHRTAPTRRIRHGRAHPPDH